MGFFTKQKDTGYVRVSDTDTTLGSLINKIVAGTNITITQNNVGGNETITISSSGGGGSFAKLTPTGALNQGSFTFTSAPSVIVVDNKALQKTNTDGTANWTGTTSVVMTVYPTFDIYGF